MVVFLRVMVILPGVQGVPSWWYMVILPGIMVLLPSSTPPHTPKNMNRINPQNETTDTQMTIFNPQNEPTPFGWNFYPLK